MPKITKNQIIWDSDDWLAGLHPQDNIGSPILFNGLRKSDSFNPFVNLGYASVGEEASDVANSSVVDGVINRIVMDEARNNAYGVGGTKLYKIATVNGDLTSDATFPHVITGTGVKLEDIVKYNISGVDYMFYSWNDNTDGDVGRLILSSSTFDDDYMSTVPTGAAVLDKDNPHPLVIGDDDFLYIGDGRNLHRYDGPTDTLIEDAFVLPAGFVIRSYAKLDNQTLVIFADTVQSGGSSSAKGTIKAFFWNYLDEDPYLIKKITGNKVGGAIEYKGTLAVFSTGLSTGFATGNRRLHFSIFDGVEFKKIRSIRILNNVNAPTVGGIDVIGDYLVASFDGKIYSFGSPFEEIKAGVIPIANLDGTAPGVVTKLSGSNLICSSGTGTSGGLQNVQSNFGIGVTETTYAEPGFDIGFIGKIKTVRVEFKQAFTGGRTLSVGFNSRIFTGGTGFSEVYGGLTSIDNDKLIDERKTDINDAPFKRFDALQLVIRWLDGEGSTDAAIIRRVVVEFETKKIDK